MSANDELVMRVSIVLYWQTFYSCIIFYFYLTCLKTREISRKIRQTRRIFAILHSPPCDNWYISNIFKFLYSKYSAFSVKLVLES